MSETLETSSERAVDETLPEMVQSFLRGGGKLENITLHAHGKWSHEGCDFENERIARLFSRSVSRTEGGTWVLTIGRFTYPIEVEDTGYFVQQVDLSTQPPTLTLSDESEEPLDPSTLTYASGGRLYCEIKGGEFRARFMRQPYYKVAEHMEEKEGKIVLTLGDQEHALAHMGDE